jgi:hypothetical protein
LLLMICLHPCRVLFMREEGFPSQLNLMRSIVGGSVTCCVKYFQVLKLRIVLNVIAEFEIR